MASLELDPPELDSREYCIKFAAVENSNKKTTQEKLGRF